MLNFGLAALSGILLVLLHPGFNLTLFAPIAITPLLYALAHEWRPKFRFLLGYTTGIVFWAGICYWIQFVMSVHGGLGTVAGTGVFILFFLAKALQLGVFGLLAGILIQHPFALPAVAALWVAIERIPGPFYFTWLLLGNAGIDMPLPLRLAPFTGVYGLSFVFAMIGAAFTWALLRRRRKAFLPLAVLIVLPFFPALPEPVPPQHTAVTLQPNIDETIEWTEPSVLQMQEKLEALTRADAIRAEVPPPSIILWPEVPAPLYYYSDPGFRHRMEKLARDAKTAVLIGTVAHNEQGSPLNAAVMITPEGQLAGRYDKMFLVPFGEYIPFPFGFAKKISTEIGDFAPGERIVLFPLQSGKIGAFICYESAFPHLVRQFAAQGATVLANLSNDGWFGQSYARFQHLSLVRMRAAENRRWILRSTNDGISAAIDPGGRIRTTMQSYVERTARLGFDQVFETTFYSEYGDVFAWTCTAGALFALLWSQRPHFNRAELQARRHP